MADGDLQGYESLRRRIAAISGPVLGKSIMGELARNTKQNAANLLTAHGNVRSGHLRQTITVEEVTDTMARVAAQAGYGLFIEGGTKAHIIKPTKAAFLAWSTTAAGRSLGGRTNMAALRGSMGLGSTGSSIRAKKGLGSGIKMLGVAGPSSGPMQFARVVHHPGTKASPFMKPGAEKAIEDAGLTDRVVAAWNKAG